MILSGSIDLECGSTTNNSERQKSVSYAVTTYVEEVRIAVRSNAGIQSISQLNGRTVVTTAGTTSAQLLRRHDSARYINFNEIYGRNHAEGMQLLESGRADAFVMDGQILAGNIAVSRNPNAFTILGAILSREPIGIMLGKDDPGFKRYVDGVLTGLMKTGEIERVYNRWFMEPLPPNNSVKIGLPANESTRAAWANPNDLPVESY